MKIYTYLRLFLEYQMITSNYTKFSPSKCRHLIVSHFEPKHGLAIFQSDIPIYWQIQTCICKGCEDIFNISIFNGRAWQLRTVHGWCIFTFCAGCVIHPLLQMSTNKRTHTQMKQEYTHSHPQQYQVSQA